jgi:osomolarity two-component system sensor histidine kinase TcsA
MADLAGRIIALSPIPTVILDPSLCVQKYSDSFLGFTQSKRDAWDGVQFLEQLRNIDIVRKSDVHRIQAIIEEAAKLKQVQHTMVSTDHVQELRVIPIVENGVLLHLVVEFQPGIRRDVRIEPDGTGLSTAEAFRLLVSAVKDYAIFLLDKTGNVRTWNAGAELIKGYKASEIIGKNFSTFYSEEDLKANKPGKELEICLREGRVEDEGWRCRKDGSRFWANVVITAVYDRGVHVGFGKVTRDLTERRNADRRLIAAYEESSKLKSDFLANMSHEIRTPMHGMLSANTLIFDTNLTDEQRDLSNIIHESGKILLQVINDILDYSKLAAGRFSLNTGVVNIAVAIKSVTRSFQTVLRPSVQFELDLSPNLPTAALGDPLRYRQVLQNLIGNAVKFTDHGLIRIHALLTEETDAYYLVLTEVKDTGIGVPDSAKNALFTPFRQFKDTSRNSYQGTGLGLSISKSLVELMGGHMGFAPNPECQGSIFSFTVPFKKTHCSDEAISSHVQDLRIAHLHTYDSQRKFFETKTLLLAEDNIINQKVMLKTLRSLGFKNIDTVLDGAQALHFVETGNRSYDLVLMDIDMPVMDGVTATRQIRGKGLQIPILALTANALKGDREVYLGIGMDDYIPKPVDRDFLAKTLMKWLVQEQSISSIKTPGSHNGASTFEFVLDPLRK